MFYVLCHTHVHLDKVITYYIFHELVQELIFSYVFFLYRINYLKKIIYLIHVQNL